MKGIMRAITKYGLVTALFIVGITVKMVTDEPHWTGSFSQYLVSTFLIIPVVWYAGYWFREALQERHDGQY